MAGREKSWSPPRWSPVAGVRPAIDVQSFAVPERGRLQVPHRLDYLIEFSHAPDRVQAGEEGVRLGLVHRRLDDAWRDSVYADALVRVLDRQRPCDGVEAALGDGRQGRRYALDGLAHQ